MHSSTTTAPPLPAGNAAGPCENRMLGDFFHKHHIVSKESLGKYRKIGFSNGLRA